MNEMTTCMELTGALVLPKFFPEKSEQERELENLYMYFVNYGNKFSNIK